MDNIKEPKFNVDFSKMVFEVGDIWHREHEPKTGFGIYRDIKDTKGVPYRVWRDHDEYYLVNMTNGNTLKRFDSDKELINYYFGNYDLREEGHIGTVEYLSHYASYVVNCNGKIFPLEQVISFDLYSVRGNVHENLGLLEDKQ